MQPMAEVEVFRVLSSGNTLWVNELGWIRLAQESSGTRLGRWQQSELSGHGRITQHRAPPP